MFRISIINTRQPKQLTFDFTWYWRVDFRIRSGTCTDDNSLLRSSCTLFLLCFGSLGHGSGCGRRENGTDAYLLGHERGGRRRQGWLRIRCGRPRLTSRGRYTYFKFRREHRLLSTTSNLGGFAFIPRRISSRRLLTASLST